MLSHCVSTTDQVSVRVLVVNGDAKASASLVTSLSKATFHVEAASSAQRAMEICSSTERPKLVVIASILPDTSGVELCRQLRQTTWTSHLPIIILSAEREDIDLVVAFELGADDYVSQPVDMRELILRIEALLRRCYPGDSASRRVGVGPLRLDRAAHRAWNGDAALALTKVEFRLLEVLMERRGRGQSREQLLEDVWGRSGGSSLRTVDTHIRRLRQKLGDQGRRICTIRGVGYRFGFEYGDPDLPE